MRLDHILCGRDQRRVFGVVVDIGGRGRVAVGGAAIFDRTACRARDNRGQIVVAIQRVQIAAHVAIVVVILNLNDRVRCRVGHFTQIALIQTGGQIQGQHHEHRFGHALFVRRTDGSSRRRSL